MKTKRNHEPDHIDRLLARSWVNLPAELQHALLHIPAEQARVRAFSVERMEFLLNLVMLLWGAGTIYFFKGLWIPMVNTMSTKLQTLNASWGASLGDPFTAGSYILGLTFFLWWIVHDFEYPLKSRSSK